MDCVCWIGWAGVGSGFRFVCQIMLRPDQWWVPVDKLFPVYEHIGRLH